jgi:hypothetical protein
MYRNASSQSTDNGGQMPGTKKKSSPAKKKSSPAKKKSTTTTVASVKLPKTLKGKTVVVTGKLKSGSRSDAEALLKKLGAATSSSISRKTSLLLAGGAAGSKLYDADSLGVPILAEGHLKLLVAGEPLDKVIASARTVYTPEFQDLNEPTLLGGRSCLGGAPLGVSTERWPTHGGKPMRHLLRLDLAALPAVQVHYPEQRMLSLFCSTEHNVDMYEIASPKNALVALRFSSQAEIDAAPALPDGVTLLPETPWRFRERPWSEREQWFGRSRILGGVPSWCQEQEHQGNFIMQLGEESGISGDGLIYVFDDTVFAQFT